MTSNDEKSYSFIICNVFSVQLKRFESKILSQFEKRAIFGVLAKITTYVFHRKSARPFSKSQFSELRRGFPFKSFLFDQYMSGLAETMILVSAEGFFLGPAEGFRAEIAKFTIQLSAKSVQKSSISPKQVQQADRWVWVRFVLPSSSAQGANHYFLMNLQVHEKLRKLFFDIVINFHVCPTHGPHHNP